MGKKHHRPESHRPGNSLQQAIALHQAGRLPEAEAIYRALPGQDANLLQLLGVLLFQTGRQAEGTSTLEKALAIDPNHVDALANLAVVHHENGRFSEALVFIERALVRDPVRPDLLDKRGFILQDLGRHEEAVASFQFAIDAAPGYADAWFHLGNSLMELKDGEEAERAFRRVIQLRPQDHEALNNLGSVLFLQLRAKEALAAINRSIEIQPTAESYLNQAAALSSLGDREGSLRAAKLAVQLEPKKASNHVRLGELQNAYKHTTLAIESYRKAVQLDPLNVEARVKLGATLNQDGRFEESQQQFASIEFPSDAARLVSSILVPIIPRSSEEIDANRTRVLTSLEAFADEDVRIDNPNRDVALTNFFWSYHSESELPLQRAVVRAYRKASTDLFWQSPHLEEKRKGKLRVGVVSGFLNQHTIGKLFIRLVVGLPDEDIEIVNFDCASKVDEWTQQLNGKVDRSYKLVTELNVSRRFIAEQKLDAIFYPEIGMSSFVYYLAFSRLAPLQFMTWGHPCSTALPNMDCFLSSHDLEREGSESDYSERLVKFDSLMTDFQRPDPKPVTRADLGLPEDKHIYACPQSLFKLHPDFDRVLAEILRRDGQGLVVLLTGNEKHWDDLVRQRFEQVMPDVADRIVILRRLSTVEYIGLCGIADA
ncbi:MAG: tetratricopeptide repeat protein, partial [Chlorobia bacterium]|nr:tetratricopeptide repeat protein [Fimbriimonadaceae bacterium]